MAAIIEKTTRPVASAERPQIRFNYRGTGVLDNEVSFYMWATDEVTAVAALERAKIKVEAIRAQSERLARRRKTISREELGNFAIQLSERTRASEQIRQAVAGIARATNNRLLREALFDVNAELKREGAHAADAFRKRPDVFPDAFCHVMQVSMKSGDPSDMLKEYGETQLRTAENISRLNGALLLPHGHYCPRLDRRRRAVLFHSPKDGRDVRRPARSNRRTVTAPDTVASRIQPLSGESSRHRLSCSLYRAYSLRRQVAQGTNRQRNNRAQESALAPCRQAAA